MSAGEYRYRFSLSLTPALHKVGGQCHPRESDLVSIVQGAGWVPGTVWTDPRTVQPVASRYVD
jgi:hypothetical protein